MLYLFSLVYLLPSEVSFQWTTFLEKEENIVKDVRLLNFFAAFNEYLAISCYKRNKFYDKFMI